jgi:hypothetical protein
MDLYQAKNLFQLQTELIDTKVEVAVKKSMDRIMATINDLKDEIYDFRREVSNQFHSLGMRVTAMYPLI